MTVTALLLTAILSAAAPEQPSSRPYAGRAVVPLSIAAGLFIAGGIFIGVSSGQVAQAARLEPEPGAALIASALSNRVGGVMLLTAGAFSVAIAAFLFWYEPTTHLTIAFTPLSGGGVFSFGWVAP